MAQYATPAKITYITTRRNSDRHLNVYRPAPQRARSISRRTIGQPLDKSVYRRRRLLAAGLFLLAVAAVLVLAQLIQAGIGGGPLTATGAAATSGSAAMIPAGTREYVVQPGDTLWSIAARVDTKGDERPLVDALDQELHGQSLFPGEQIAIPSHW